MSTPKAYLDAGVLVAYGLGPDDRHYENAKAVINDIMQGDYKGVVSLLALLETKDVIRKRIVGKTPKNVLDAKSGAEKKNHIEQESAKRYVTLIDNVTKAAKAKKMLIVDFKGVSIADVFDVCDYLLSKNFGDIKLYSRCFACNASYEHYEYKGMGPIDAMHFDLAKRMPCELFITTDKGFAGLDGQIAVSII